MEWYARPFVESDNRNHAAVHRRRQQWEDGDTHLSSADERSISSTPGPRLSIWFATLGISNQTIYVWRRQEAIDRGLVAGLTSAEREELAAAKRRIRELESELAIHRRASELLAEHSHPKAVRGD